MLGERPVAREEATTEQLVHRIVATNVFGDVDDFSRWIHKSRGVKPARLGKGSLKLKKLARQRAQNIRSNTKATYLDSFQAPNRKRFQGSLAADTAAR